MSYTVDRYQNNSLQPGWPVIVNDGTINATSTSLKIPGRGIPNYGELIAENFVHILENFAGPNPPQNPVVGQLWFDTSISNTESGSIKVYNGIDFVRVGGVEVDQNQFFTSPSTGKKGDVRFYSSPNDSRLYVHDGQKWLHVNGITISGTQPSDSKNGDLWYDNNNLKIKIGNYWYTLLLSTVSQNINSGTISFSVGSSNLVVVVLNDTVVAIFSDSIVTQGNLPSNFQLFNGNIVNLNNLFPQGLRIGLNFSNISSNSIISNANVNSNFEISNYNGGNLLLRAALSAGVLPSEISTLKVVGSANSIRMTGRILCDSNSSIKLPAGNTSQRPSNPQPGDFRFNTQLNDLEFFDPLTLTWKQISSGGGGGGATFPPGTRMIFYNSAVPVGWTSLGLNDFAIRTSLAGSVRAGNATNSLGNGFSSMLSTITVNVSGKTREHVLTISEMPRHGHKWRGSNTDETTGRINPQGGFSKRNKNTFIAGPFLGENPTDNAYRSIGGAGGYLISGGDPNNPSHWQTSGHSHLINLNIPVSLNIRYINVIVGEKT